MDIYYGETSNVCTRDLNNNINENKINNNIMDKNINVEKNETDSDGFIIKKQGFNDEKMDQMPMTMPPKKVPGLIDSVTENIKYNFLNVNKVNRYLCQCFNRHTYIWLDNGKSFWIWLIAIHDAYIICYRWNGSRWVSAQIAKNKIKQIG